MKTGRQIPIPPGRLPVFGLLFSYVSEGYRSQAYYYMRDLLTVWTSEKEALHGIYTDEYVCTGCLRSSSSGNGYLEPVARLPKSELGLPALLYVQKG
jgi:hypothetical protein